MKKHKSVVAILLAVMMIFTFMPTMSFAASTAGHDFSNTTAVDATYPGLKVLVEPTCTAYGVGEITCTIDLNGEKCGAVKTVKIKPLGHKAGRIIRISALEAIDYTVKDAAANKAAKEAYYAEQKLGDTNICEGYVSVCDNCGGYLNKGTSTPFTGWKDLADTTKHTLTGAPVCAETYNCSVCGAEAKQEGAKPHTMETAVTRAHVTSNGFGGENYVEVTSSKCSVCGKDGETTRRLVGYSNWNPVTHSATTRVEVPSAQPCKTPSGYQDVCNDCGMVVQSGQNPLAAHTWMTSAPYAKDDGLMYTKEVCAVCGAEKPSSEVAVAFVPPAGTDSIAYKAVSEANCEQGSFIISTYTSASGAVTETILSDTEVEAAVTSGSLVKIGDKIYNKNKQVEVPYTKAVGHKFGNITKVAEATCEEPGIEAKVCENCGKVDHATVKNIDKPLGHQYVQITQDPTCGAKGFTVEQCSVCGKYKNNSYKEVGKPVVAYGTKCKFDKWIVEKAATPFEEGTKKLVCSVCGDDGHLTWEDGVKEMGVTRTFIAKTKIAAPAVKAGKKKATVTVKAVEGAVKYQIKVNGKVKKTVKKAGKVTIKKLAGGKKAKFQIVAFNEEGVKAASTVKSVKIKK